MTVVSREFLKERAWIAVPVIGAALVLLFLRLEAGSLAQSAVYDVTGLLAVLAAIVGVRLHRPADWLPWALLAAGQFAFVVGDVLWTTYAALGEDPFPSLADVSYVAGYPLLALGLLVAIRRRISGGDRAGLLDAAILTTGAAVFWWAFVLGPLALGSDPEPVSFAISVAYPIGDLLLIGMALGLALAPGARSVSFGLLAASLGLQLGADLVFGLQTVDETYVDGGTLDAFWLLAYLAFGAAALHPAMSALFVARPVAVALLSPARLGLLAAAMLVGPALLVLGTSSVEGVVLVVAGASAVLSVLVLVRLAGMVRILARDIERRQALEEQLSYQAFHDPLTGLANRRRFMAAVGEGLAKGTGTAVLFLDLDDFKDVNDEMGHDAGDALLTAIGHRILASVRPGDLACRLGGDEFAVALPDTGGVEDAEVVAARLLEAIGAPVVIEERTLRVPASVGVALCPADQPMTADELVRRADMAMYHAKARGKDRSATWVPELEGEAEGSVPVRAATRRPPRL